jgi:sortase A
MIPAAEAAWLEVRSPRWRTAMPGRRLLVRARRAGREGPGCTALRRRARSRPLAAAAAVAVAVTGLAGAALALHGLWIPAKAALAQVLLERAWGRAVAGEQRPRPWPGADTWPVARLRLPEPGGGAAELIVLAGASGRTLAFGPGHLDGTARPGDGGNVAIAGHRDTHFRRLAALAPGDPVELEALDAAGRPRLRRYRVTAARVVDKSAVSVLAADGPPTLTLITCWPFDAVVPGGPLRYVVTAVE